MLHRRLALALVLSLALGTAAVAQPDSSEFFLTGSFQLRVGGEIDRQARMYQSQSPQAVLVVSDRVEAPLILLPGSGNVQSVPLMRLVPRSKTAVALLKGEPLQVVGKFEVGGSGIAFSLGGLDLRLESKEPVVGQTDSSTLFEHSPEYRIKADLYQPDAAAVAKLKEVGEGYVVRVVFGSWCHVCENFLPRGLKVEEAIAGSAIRFEYVGLPRNPWEPKHPAVSKYNVQSLPTAIVYKGDKEIGRFAGGEQWQRPEQKMLAAIEKAR